MRSFDSAEVSVRRERLLRAARSEYAKYGFSQSSLDNICARAKIPRDTFHRYFRDQEDLYHASQRKWLDWMAETCGPFPRTASTIEFWDAIGRILASVAAELEKRRQVGCLGKWIHLGQSQPERQAMCQAISRTREWVLDALGKGRRAGAIATSTSDEFLAEVIVAILIGVDRFLSNRAGMAPEDLGAAASRIEDALRAILLPAPMRSPHESRCTFTERVQEELEALLLQGSDDIAHLAARMGLSARALQRRFEREDTTFALERDAVRERLARALLGDRLHTVREIGELLGYRSQSAFSRAFRRWTGVSPREFRVQASVS